MTPGEIIDEAAYDALNIEKEEKLENIRTNTKLQCT